MQFKFLSLLFPALSLALALPAEAQKAVPVATGGAYTLTAGPVSVVVGPTRGARIRSLKYDGTEMLFQDSSGSPSSHGSSFWPSPQAHWTATCRNANNNGCWQPPTAFDGSGAASVYTGGLTNDSGVTYTGSQDTYTTLRLRKTLWADLKDTSIAIRYHLINGGSAKIAFAGWEVTRMTTGGLTFWAKSLEDTIRGNGTSGTALINMITDTLGVKWHKYDSTVSLSAGTPKFWDGTSEGWYAHVDKSRLLYIKKFQDAPASKKAPVSENQIEYYTNNNTRSMIEMELQSAFDSIAVGDSMTWDVKWYVRRLPDSIPVTRNASLLALVRKTVAGNTVSIRAQARASAGIFERMTLSSGRVGLTLDRDATVSLSLLDARGREVQSLHNGALQKGAHAFRIGAVPHGVYWIVLRGANAEILEARMLPSL
jgi:hypothetical protein